MAKFMKLEIDNSKRSAISSGGWSDPGAKLYDQLLQSYYCVGDLPADGKSMEKAIKEGKYKQWYDFLKEAYLVAPIKDIKNSPYGVTPYTRSGCKYPHHVIRNDKLVVSIPGLKAAYSRAKQMGIFTGEVKEHLERHYKEMGIYEGSTMQINEQIEQNFADIEKYIFETTGIDLHCPTTLFEEEVDNGSIRPLSKEDVTNPYFVEWLFRSYEFSDDDPNKFDYDMLVNNDTIGNYVYGYFVNDKLEGIIKVKHRKPEDYYAISMLFVNDKNESNGIGQTLMKYVIDKFGDKEMRLNVFAFNAKAIHIYKKYGFDIAETIVTKPEEDGRETKLTGLEMHKMVRKPQKSSLYDPPLPLDKLPAHLKNDPVHSWRAKTGIELIHKEPTLEELNRIWDNWNKMTPEQKSISDQKSMELFGKNNQDHYNELLKEYNVTSVDILDESIDGNDDEFDDLENGKDFVPIYGIVKSYSSSILRNDGTEKSNSELNSIKFDRAVHKLTRGDNYSHALVSFDDSLTKMYSYDDEGFVTDDIMSHDSWMGTKSIYICVMFVPREDKERMMKFVKELEEHPESTKYAFANLLKAFIGRPYKADKRFVCSSFTGYIMSCANPKNLHRDYSRLRPEDITILPRAFYIMNVTDREDFKQKRHEIRNRVNAIYDEYEEEIDDYNNHLPKLMLKDRCDKLKTSDKIFDWIIDRI